MAVVSDCCFSYWTASSRHPVLLAIWILYPASPAIKKQMVQRTSSCRRCGLGVGGWWWEDVITTVVDQILGVSLNIFRDHWNANPDIYTSKLYCVHVVIPNRLIYILYIYIHTAYIYITIYIYTNISSHLFRTSPSKDTWSTWPKAPTAFSAHSWVLSCRPSDASRRCCLLTMNTVDGRNPAIGGLSHCW